MTKERKGDEQDPLRTKLNILAAAEKLFSLHGIDGTSLRQISKLSGNRNLFAAQYHFGDKDNLIALVFEKHAPELEKMRAEILDSSPISLDHLPLASLMELIVRPLAMYRNEEGQRSYARFIRFVMQYDPSSELWSRHHDSAPYTRAIYARLRALCPPASDATWRWKVALIGKLIVDAIYEYDVHGKPEQLCEEEFIEELSSIAAGALFCHQMKAS